MRLFSPMFLAAAVGCGGSGSPGGPGPGATDHSLASSQPATFSAGGYYGYEFILPSSAELSFAVSPASTTSPDRWTVGLFTSNEWVSFQNGSSNQAYAAVANDVTTDADSAMIPSGDWYLGFKCTNSLERCMVTFDVDALY